MPPSAWIGSTITAQVLSVIAARARRDVAERQEAHRLDQRPEAGAVLRLAGHGERAHGAAVEAVLERDQLGALRARLGDHLIAARELQRGFVGLGAGVAKEDAPLERAALERLGQTHLGLEIIEIRRVHQLARLRGDRVGQAGMTVPEHADGDARGHVEIAAAVGVPERATLAAAHHHGRLAVVVEEQLLPRLHEIVLRRHEALHSSSDLLYARAMWIPVILGLVRNRAGP